MNNKIIVSFLFLFLISSSFCFSIQILPINDSVKPGENLVYDIIVSNTANSMEKDITMFLVSSTFATWSFKPNYHFKIGAGETKKITFSAGVNIKASQGRFNEPIMFNIDGITQTSQYISYTVEGPEQYFDFMNLTVPEQIDPRNPFNLTVNFENEYNDRINYIDSIIEIYGDNQSSIYYGVVPLKASKGINDRNMLIKLNDNTLPQDVNIKVSLSWFDLNFGTKVVDSKIVGYTQKDLELLKMTSITKTTNGVILTNNGTIALNSYEYVLKLNGLNSLFISSPLNHTKTFDSIIFYIDRLEPGEQIKLYYEQDYTLLYLIPIIIFVIIYFYYSLTKQIKVKRKIVEFKSNQNSISFKILLSVENISKEKIKKLIVKETLPPIISEVYGFGTLKGKIKTIDSRKLITWELSRLKPGEKVVLSYKMRSKVGFIGELELENTKLTTINKKGKVKNMESNNSIVVEILSLKE